MSFFYIFRLSIKGTIWTQSNGKHIISTVGKHQLSSNVLTISKYTRNKAKKLMIILTSGSVTECQKHWVKHRKQEIVALKLWLFLWDQITISIKK